MQTQTRIIAGLGKPVGRIGTGSKRFGFKRERIFFGNRAFIVQFQQFQAACKDFVVHPSMLGIAVRVEQILGEVRLAPLGRGSIGD